MKSSLEALGYKDVCQISESHLFRHFRATRKGRDFFIKAAKDLSAADFLRREVTYANFLTSRGLPEGVSMLTGDLHSDQETAFCAFPFVECAWLGAQRPDRLLVIPDQRLERNLAALERLHSSFTVAEIEAAYGPDKYSAAEQMRNGLTKVVKPAIGTKISAEEFDVVYAWASQQRSGSSSFQHNDVMPPNIGWLDGGLLLIDAQFSGIRMKWWDAAYFFIQTYTFFQSPDLAKRVLRFMLAEFAAEGIKEEILRPLRYRSTINVVESEGVSHQLARQLWKRAQTEDLDEILR